MADIDVERLRYWLVRKPQGHFVKAYANGDCTVIEKHANQTWGDVSRTIESLEADRIELFTNDSKLIRASRLDEFLEEDEAPPPGANMKPSRGMYDAETERLKLVAGLIAEAYKFATGVAWEKMLGLFDAIARKSEATERSLDKAQGLITKQALENFALKIQEQDESNGGEDLLTQMMQQFLAGKNAAGEVNNTRSNGKAKS